LPSREEIASALKYLKIIKPAGADSIAVELLKTLKKAMSRTSKLVISS
jgi:hypothetical protein